MRKSAGSTTPGGTPAATSSWLIELYSWYARYTQGAAAVVPKGLILSLIAVCILGFTGWKGWEMVYRGRVGIADAPDPYGHRASESPRRAA